MLDELAGKISKAIEVLQNELAGIRAGRASSNLVENLLVESYGSKMPLKQVASISVPDARSLAIQPWDRANLAGIERAIRQSDLGLNPVNDGTMVRLNIPPLSSERRDELIKLIGQRAEAAKVTIRNLRHEAMEVIDHQVKDKAVSEDESKRLQKTVQDKIDQANVRVEQVLVDKETEIKTV